MAYEEGMFRLLRPQDMAPLARMNCLHGHRFMYASKHLEGRCRPLHWEIGFAPNVALHNH